MWKVKLPMKIITFIWKLLHHSLLVLTNLIRRGIQTANRCVRDRASGPFYGMLGQTHVNGWSRVVASQNGGSTSYIFPLRLGVLQWSRNLFNYWKNKKTIIEKFLIVLICNLIYIDHRKITWLWS